MFVQDFENVKCYKSMQQYFSVYPLSPVLIIGDICGNSALMLGKILTFNGFYCVLFYYFFICVREFRASVFKGVSFSIEQVL